MKKTTDRIVIERESLNYWKEVTAFTVAEFYNLSWAKAFIVYLFDKCVQSEYFTDSERYKISFGDGRVEYLTKTESNEFVDSLR